MAINITIEELTAELLACQPPVSRKAAEIAFALAVLLRDDDSSRSDNFAQETIAILDQLPSSTIEDVTSSRMVVGGVQIPDYFHADVVRNRFPQG